MPKWRQFEDLIKNGNDFEVVYRAVDTERNVKQQKAKFGKS